MRLIYTANGPKKGQEVKRGDKVHTGRGEEVTVTFFRPPTSSASEGKVTIQHRGSRYEMEYYVSVIGAKWIEREDRHDIGV